MLSVLVGSYGHSFGTFCNGSDFLQVEKSNWDGPRFLPSADSSELHQSLQTNCRCFRDTGYLVVFLCVIRRLECDDVINHKPFPKLPNGFSHIFSTAVICGGNFLCTWHSTEEERGTDISVVPWRDRMWKWRANVVKVDET